ncbi:hypothetical protein EDD86DRAFT_210884 [Gorgonomyces haynaldii]|nr:hypothetical protein EDD86DRAFT_210884 [Gorgonomyces haynaldii]
MHKRRTSQTPLIEKPVVQQLDKPVQKQDKSYFLLAVLLICTLGFQIAVVRPMSLRVQENAQKLQELERHVVNVSLPSVPEHVEDVHHSYKPPLNPGKQFSYDDFEEKFNVQPLHYVMWDPDLSRVLDQHDAKKASMYTEDVEGNEENTALYCPYIRAGSQEKYERERYYIKWSSMERGYGLFAKKDLKEGEVVGLYTGIGTRSTFNTDYMWTYPSDYLPKGDEFGMDSLRIGNYMRFVNHAGDELNTRPEYTLCDNRWYVMYIAHEDIPKDTELFTSYGDAYFETRGLDL